MYYRTSNRSDEDKTRGAIAALFAILFLLGSFFTAAQYALWKDAPIVGPSELRTVPNGRAVLLTGRIPGGYGLLAYTIEHESCSYLGDDRHCSWEEDGRTAPGFQLADQEDEVSVSPGYRFSGATIEIYDDQYHRRSGIPFGALVTVAGMRSGNGIAASEVFAGEPYRYVFGWRVATWFLRVMTAVALAFALVFFL